MIELLNQYSIRWAEFFGLVLIQNTIFLGLIFVLLHLLKDTDALKKYIVAIFGVAKLLLPPFIPAKFLSNLFTISNNSVGIEFGRIKAIPITGEIDAAINLNLQSLLLILWMITAGVSLLIPLISNIRFRLRLHDAKPIRPKELIKEFENSAIKVFQSEKISMPLTFGIFSKKIYVPSQWDNWSSDCQRMILHHELAHIKRKDGLVKFFQIIVQSIYFFHPLVWILNTRINQYREMACDDASVATKRNSSMEYSRYLVNIAEEMTLSELSCSSASALIRQKNELLNRVQYQIKEVTMKHISKKKLGVIVAVLFLSLGLFSFTFSSSSPPDEPGNFAVQKTGKVHGNIKDSQTGKPIKGANVSIEETTLWAASDGEGKYFITNVPPGVYNLEARKDAYKNVIVSKVSVKEAQSTKIDFKLEPVLMKISETGEDAPPPSPPPAKEKLVKVRETEKDEIPPPPPPPIDKKEHWVDYDNPPEVVGGFGEVIKVLKYPEGARKSGVAGFVHVTLQIDEDGKIVDSKIKKSLQPDCDKAALEALKAVNWKPALKKGKPVKVWVTVPVKFALK